jgi:hypothetical protein
MKAIKELSRIENVIRILAVIFIMPVWIITMYEGVIKLGFTHLGF